MAKPIPAVDPGKCRTELCIDGVCAALALCPHGVLRQEAPGEIPYLASSNMCRGCFACLGACPARAIIKLRG